MMPVQQATATASWAGGNFDGFPDRMTGRGEYRRLRIQEVAWVDMRGPRSQ